MATSLFSFVTPSAGLYGFRLLYFEGGGGASVAWYSTPDGTAANKVLINSPDGWKAHPRISSLLPPVVDILSPGLNAINISGAAVLQAGLVDGTGAGVNPGSVELKVNGVRVVASIVKDSGHTSVLYDPPGLMEPWSRVEAVLTYEDNSSPPNHYTLAWPFTVVGHRNITVAGRPFASENFNRLPEGGLPAGWTVENQTDRDNNSSAFNNCRNTPYRNWTVIPTDRITDLAATGSYSEITNIAPSQFVNGVPVTWLLDGKFLLAASTDRRGKQVQTVITRDFDCSGRTNVYLYFHSGWRQNQDSLFGVEYSADGGRTWQPALYCLDGPDVVRRSDGTVDARATLETPRDDIARTRTNGQGSFVTGRYGDFILSPLSDTLAPFISARVNDDPVESMRVEFIRLRGADNQPTEIGRAHV